MHPTKRLVDGNIYIDSKVEKSVPTLGDLQLTPPYLSTPCCNVPNPSHGEYYLSLGPL